MAIVAFMISFTHAETENNSTKPKCITLDTSNVCGQSYVGLQVLQPAFSSVADFNEKLAKAFLNEDSIATEFDTFFGCSKNDVAPLLSSIRYRLSFWCSQAVSEAVKYGCSGKEGPFRLCTEECDTSVKTTKAILDQKGICKGNATQVENRKGLINVMNAICDASSSSNCNRGAELETKYCGKG